MMSTETPVATVHVFVSSTWLDLQPEREAVEKALHRTQVVADLHNLLGGAPSAGEEEPSQRGPKYQVSITDAQGVVIGDGAQVRLICTIYGMSCGRDGSVW